MILTWFLPLLLLLLAFFANIMILASHPVRSVLALMGCFLGTSILWLMMGADFLAFVLIFVYVGAVMTLFLFMVMMLNVSRYADDALISRFYRCLIVLVTFVVPVTGYLCLRLYGMQPVSLISIMRTEWGLSTAHLVEFSRLLYQTYWMPLQLLAFILMIPMVVATGIVRRGVPVDAKLQSRSKQVGTHVKDRLTLVNAKKTGSR